MQPGPQTATPPVGLHHSWPDDIRVQGRLLQAAALKGSRYDR